MKTIALDFDGVLHSYTSGWGAPHVIPDPPVPGMAQLCRHLMDLGFQVVVMSSRARFLAGKVAMEKWLQENGFPAMHVTDEKIPALLYVDDRAFRFTGDPCALLNFIAGNMEPWNKGSQMSTEGTRP